MANTFKIDTKSSVVNDAITNSNCNVVTAGGSATLILLSCLISNKSGTSVDVDVYLVTSAGDDVYLLNTVPIPAGSSLEVMSGNKLVLMNDGTNADNLEAIASAASSLDVTVSVLEDV